MVGRVAALKRVAVNACGDNTPDNNKPGKHRRSHDRELAELIAAIESDNYPARQNSTEYYARTEVPDAYIAGITPR